MSDASLSAALPTLESCACPSPGDDSGCSRVPCIVECSARSVRSLSARRSRTSLRATQSAATAGCASTMSCAWSSRAAAISGSMRSVSCTQIGRDATTSGRTRSVVEGKIDPAVVMAVRRKVFGVSTCGKVTTLEGAQRVGAHRVTGSDRRVEWGARVQECERVECCCVVSGGVEVRFEIDVAAMPDPVLVGGRAMHDHVRVDECVEVVGCVGLRAFEQSWRCSQRAVAGNEIEDGNGLARSICSVGKASDIAELDGDLRPP